MGFLFNRVVIAGVGLIGGSLAIAGKKRGIFGRTIGLGRTRKTLERALELGVVDEISDDPAVALAGADLFFAAAPVESIVPLCLKVEGNLPDDCVITDGGSVKGRLTAELTEKLKHPSRFVGGHPIAGTEKSGPEAAFATLYEKRYTILTPTPATSAEALRKVRVMWETVGSKVVEMTPEEHDRALALISHLPHVAAYALVETLDGMDPDRIIRGFAAGGFRDTTRIAASHPEMWRDIFSMNQSEVVKAIREYEKSLAGMREAIERADWAGLTERLERARRAKIEMERVDNERKNANNDDGFPIPPRLVIAIDGPAGSGKSTMARLVAEKLNAVNIDTGAMYRSVTALMLDAGLDPADEKKAKHTANNMNLRFERHGQSQKVIVNGADFTARIRKPDVDASVSIVAAHPAVRQRLVDIQRMMGADGRVVMEGRDIGSHVFPDADVKFYLTAHDDTRAKRRNKDLKEQGASAGHEETLEGIRSRDRIDSSRSASPLAKPEGAVEMDTSDLTIDEALGKMLETIFCKINRRSGGPVRSMDRKDR